MSSSTEISNREVTSQAVESGRYGYERHAAQAELDETDAALAKVQTAKALVNLPPGQSIREAWDQASIEWVRTVTLLVADYVLIKPRHPRSHLWNGYRFNPDSYQAPTLIASLFLVKGARRANSFVACGALRRSGGCAATSEGSPRPRQLPLVLRALIAGGERLGDGNDAA